MCQRIWEPWPEILFLTTELVYIYWFRIPVNTDKAQSNVFVT